MSSYYTISNSKIFRKLKQIDFYNIFLNVTLLLLITATILLIVNPSKYMSSINAGVTLFYYSVFPSLFPFLFLSKLLDGLGAFSKLSRILKPATKGIFKVPEIASYPLIMTLVSGYPVGAKIVGDLHSSGQITAIDAKRIIVLSSTSGPIFVIGSVGTGMLQNPRLGALIFLSHILGAFFTALLFTIKKPMVAPSTAKSTPTKPNDSLLPSTATSTIMSILTVAVYVSIFYMFIDMAYDLKILTFGTKFFDLILPLFKIDKSYSFALASGLVEMTRGCKEIALIGNDFYSLIFSSGLISFGGISIILQSLTFLSSTKIKPLYFVFLKLTQMIITIFVAIPIGLLFL